MNYQIKFETGEDDDWRGVAFLDADERKINAHDFFYNLRKNNLVRRSFNARFDAWRDGQKPKKHRYHGFDKKEYKGRYSKCFVFKYDKHRLYGFLCHPKTAKPRYQICVLVRHAIKNTWESDENELSYVEEMRKKLHIKEKSVIYLKEKK